VATIARSSRPHVSGVLARPRVAILVSLLALSAIGWVFVVWQPGTHSSMHTHGGMAMGLDVTMSMAAPIFLAMWVAMMVAMMFPAAAPVVLLFDRVERGKPGAGRSYVPTACFVGAYLAIWTAFGVLAFLLAAGVDNLADDRAWVTDNWARFGGVLLIAAGLYQLSPFKDACLSKCRTPASFLTTSSRDGKIGAIQRGLVHGGYCVGCCWLLFLILLPLGVMNVAATLVVALLVFGEKCLPAGNRLARAAAPVLVVYGLVVTLFPDALFTTVT
jgi:predicted metal-binding membrane protein